MLTETNSRADIGLSALSQKIEDWRGQKPRSRSVPEELWQEATEAARSWGVSRVAAALKVGYARLRQRSGVEGVRKAAHPAQASVPALNSQFVELSDLSPIRDETVVEVTVPDGTRLTIRLKGSTNVVESFAIEPAKPSSCWCMTARSSGSVINGCRKVALGSGRPPREQWRRHCWRMNCRR